MTVQVASQPDEQELVFFGMGTVDVDASGHFALDGLAAGRVCLFLMLPGPHGPVIVERRWVELREGEMTRAEFKVRESLVSGHVTRNRQPAAGLCGTKSWRSLSASKCAKVRSFVSRLFWSRLNPLSGGEPRSCVRGEGALNLLELSGAR